MKHNKIFTCLCCLALVTHSHAQNVLSAEAAIAAALKSNYDILLLKSDSSSFALDNSYSKAAFYPRINASTGMVFNTNNQKQKLADGSVKERNGIRSDNINAAISLNWTVFDGMKMFATRDKLAAFVKLGELNIKNQVVNTIAAVLSNYYNIVRQKQQLKAIEEQMGLNEERLKQADKKLGVGLGAKPDVLQAKTDLNAQKAALLQQETLIAQLKEQLNLLMAAPLQAEFEVVDSIPIDHQILLNEVLNTAAKNNPALQTAQQNIQIAGLALKERKAERFPIVSLNSAYNFGKTDNKSVLNTFTPLYNRNLGFNYGISASIPIFNGYNTKRQIEQAQLDINYNKIVLEKIKATNEIAIINAFKTYELQKKTLGLEEENILLAKENVFIAMERFRLGISTTLELRATQKTLEDAYNRLIAARYNAKLAEIDLMRLKGDLLK
ncbi:MAG: TolC family protein [Chitinophagaceae bacterium]